MKLPLLLEARPRHLVGTNVMLLAGDWRIEADGLKDTCFNICLDNSDLVPFNTGLVINLTKDTPVKVSINVPGKEPSITVWAVRV